MLVANKRLAGNIKGNGEEQDDHRELECSPIFLEISKAVHMPRKDLVKDKTHSPLADL